MQENRALLKYGRFKMCFVDSFQCVTRSVHMPVMPKMLWVSAPNNPPIQLTSLTAEQLSDQQRKTTTNINQQSSNKRQRTSPSITESDECMNSMQTSPPTLSLKRAPIRQSLRQLIKQKQIEKKVHNPKNLPAKSRRPSHHTSVRNMLPRCALSNRVLCFPYYEETAMTVGEAESAKGPDSD